MDGWDHGLPRCAVIFFIPVPVRIANVDEDFEGIGNGAIQIYLRPFLLALIEWEGDVDTSPETSSGERYPPPATANVA